ncbi:MAG: Hsp20/alpha crystallin family protein [candidate division NC10 bacterium]|nr:Hsp20/alpha crystallin family protein [candidate division NC10 bacterium]
MDDPISKLYFTLMKRLEGEMEEAFGRMWRRYLSLPAAPNPMGIAPFSSSITGSPQYWRPATDIFETEEEFIVRVEIAGLRQDSLKIFQSLEGRKLWLQGEKRDEEKEVRGQAWYHQLEIYYGAFELPIYLPPGVRLDLEEVKASYQDGILVLRISKRRESEPQKRERILSIPVEGE